MRTYYNRQGRYTGSSYGGCGSLVIGFSVLAFWVIVAELALLALTIMAGIALTVGGAMLIGKIKTKSTVMLWFVVFIGTALLLILHHPHYWIIWASVVVLLLWAVSCLLRRQGITVAQRKAVAQSASRPQEESVWRGYSGSLLDNIDNNS